MTISFELKNRKTKLRVTRFDALEGLSELFEFTMTLIAYLADAVEIDDLLGQDAVLKIATESGPRFVHGVLVRFEQSDVDEHFIAYSVTMVPRVQRLLHRYDCRVFEPQKERPLLVQEILERVFERASLGAGKDYRIMLGGKYAPRECCVQYRESDWAFCCRLMEEEGIHYFFEHNEKGHVLVIADLPDAHADIPCGGVRFCGPRGGMQKGEHVSRFRYGGEVAPDAVTLRDHDFERPNEPLDSQAKATASGQFAIYDFPGTYASSASGKRRARIRLEEHQVARKQGRGQSSVPWLEPGRIFELCDHPHDSMNRKYLVTRVEHSSTESALPGETAKRREPRYENRFHCIPSDVPFRPPRVTPRPMISGMQTAVVVCASGEEVETDRHGRVKVRFRWDRANGTSGWVRVSQQWAGAGFGTLFVPREGQEVLVDFLEGDPDRPIIVGSLYDGTHVTPFPLPASRTRSGIKTKTSPNGNGSNELWFEDHQGNEEIHLHAQRDWTSVVEHDQVVDIKHARRLQVGAEETVEIGADRRVVVKANDFATVSGDRTVEVKKNVAEWIEGNRTVDVGASASVYVAGTDTKRIDGDGRVHVGRTFTLTAGERIELTAGGLKITIGGGQVSIEGGALTVNGRPVMLT